MSDEPTPTPDGYSAAYKAAYEAALSATPKYVAAHVDDPDVHAVAAASTSATPGGRPTLDDYMKRYDPDTTLHPWARLLRSVPMGGERAPMNHDVHVLNMVAIHLERLGFVDPDPDRAEIKYVAAPFNGDALLSPGQWVDLDAEEPEAPTIPELDLTGVPPNQLDVLEQAVQAERVRLAKLATADPDARAAAVSQDTPMTLGVVPLADGGTSA